MSLTPLYELSPEQKAFYDAEISRRLNGQGLPLRPGNDYELHLTARKLRKDGRTRNETAEILLELAKNIDIRARESYVNDILDSILVGYSDKLPIYV